MGVEMWTLKMIAWRPLGVWIQCGTSGHASTQRMQYRDHTEKVFPPPASQKITGRGNTIVCFEMTLRCVWTKICRVKLVIFPWLFSTVCFQMAVQMARLKWCKSHRSHFFSFSPLRFQMCPQNIYIRGRKVTLVAYVWVFSTVCLQMYPQITCLTRCKVTLVAFVWLSPLCFQMRDSFCVINLPSSGDE